nr:GDSL esterase/lipase EXL3-like [Ipomoea batatas]
MLCPPPRICLQRRTVCFVVGVLLLFASAGEAKMKLPDGAVVPAIIGLGDSIIDQGMNNYIPTVVKCDFPPYGQDFAGGGMPTGRFSNGKTPPDLIAEELGIKELVPAYLDPNLQPEDLKTGVSFASGACGYDPETAEITSVIPLSQQLDYLKEYLGKLRSAYGENETKFITDNAVFFVVAGSDDLANTYFTVGLRRLQYDINSYTDLMVEGASTFIQELYEIGARRIGVFGLPPIGCVPSQRTLGGGPGRSCSEKSNEAAKLVNSKLSAQIDSLSKTLPNSKLVLIDIYEPALRLIQNPKQYGFEVVDRGCCGTGKIEVSILCNKFSETCPDHDKYMFWDSYHPTEKGYKILVNQILQKYINRLL